jgi:hypothetical protein
MDYFTEEEKQAIIAELKPYIEEAKKHRMIFYNKGISTFLLPEELEEAQAKGEYLLKNWMLYHACDRYRNLNDQANEARRRADEFLEKMVEAGYM